MAKKDYVKRGRNTKAAPKQVSRRKPWRSGLLALILVGAFGYGLYYLGNEPEPPKPAVATTPAKPKPQPKPSKPLPPPPEEKWEYVDTLPNKEVKVTAKEQKISDVPYVMQCGAYKSMETAQERKANIAFQGIRSQIKKKEGSSWYRVVLGPYTFKRDAERDRHKLQRAKIEPCAIWKEHL